MKTFFYQTEWFYVPSISKSVSQSSSSSLPSTFWKKLSPSGDNEPEESLRRMPVGGLNAAYNATQNVIQISNKVVGYKMLHYCEFSSARLPYGNQKGNSRHLHDSKSQNLYLKVTESE